MTTPNSPNLGQAVTDLGESSVVMRIGTVAKIEEASNITVKISGTDVLVEASYAFPQYQPLLGDLVIVNRQDAQWFVLGTMSGPNNSVALNPSFEEGPGSGDPDDWNSINDTVTAGVPTTDHAFSTFALDGTGYVVVQMIPTGLGASVTRLVSQRVPADPGSQWTGAAFSWVVAAGSNTSVSAEVLIRFLDSAGLTLAVTTISVANSNARQQNWFYNRTTFDPSVTAPDDTESVRLELLTRFSITTAATQGGAVFWDRAILRGPL